jgi:hypothetical protein
MHRKLKKKQEKNTLHLLFGVKLYLGLSKQLLIQKPLCLKIEEEPYHFR